MLRPSCVFAFMECVNDEGGDRWNVPVVVATGAAVTRQILQWCRVPPHRHDEVEFVNEKCFSEALMMDETNSVGVACPRIDMSKMEFVNEKCFSRGAEDERAGGRGDRPCKRARLGIWPPLDGYETISTVVSRAAAST